MQNRVLAYAVKEGLKPIPGIKNILAVASAKGGVGKSTVAANLALALAKMGAKVGMLDADIYGPSQPAIFGAVGRAEATPDKKFIPLIAHGLPVLSIGHLIDEGTPVIWRGPMATGAIWQLLTETVWGELDYLIIDMPPGTGDIQLTVAQKVPVTGVVMVTTPQKLSLLDVAKGIEMWQKLEIPVLGIIENMSGEIFGTAGGENLAARYHLPLFGKIPLDAALNAASDTGIPFMLAYENHPIGTIIQNTASEMIKALSTLPKSTRFAFSNITVKENRE